MPGIGLVMDGAMQQAPQPGRQAGAGALGREVGTVRGGEGGDAIPGLSARWRAATSAPKIGGTPTRLRPTRPACATGRRSAGVPFDPAATARVPAQ